MKLEISLSPSGGLRLHLPQGRTLDVEVAPTERVCCTECGEIFRAPVQTASLKAVKQVLHDAASYVKGKEKPGYIGPFPTQAVLDVWAKEFKKKHDEESIAAASERLGVDIEKLEISI